MIIVKYDGTGATLPSREFRYETVFEAQKNNWAPVGRGFGHSLYKKAKENGGFARDGRNIVIIQD